MARKLPKGWSRVALGDVCEINPRADALNGVDRISFVAMADTSEAGRLVSHTTVPVTRKSVAGYTRFRRGDILCAKITPCFENGKGALTDNLHTAQGIGSTEFHVIRTSERILPEIAHAIIQSTQFRRRGELWMTGSAGQKRVPADYIAEYEIELPSLDEQRRIVSVLDAADRQVDLAESIAKKAVDQSAAVARKLIASITGKQVDLAQVVSRVRRPPTSDDVVPLTISAAIGLVSQSTFFGRRVASDVVDGYTLIRHGEFAYNKSYSNGYPYGAIKRLEVVKAGVLSSLYLCFGVDDEKVVNGDYLAAVCESGFFNRQIHMIAHEGARNHGLLNVSAEDFFAMTFPLPEINEQKRIAETVRFASMRSQHSRERVQALEQQKRGLTQQLLTGQQRLTRDLPGMEHADV